MEPLGSRKYYPRSFRFLLFGTSALLGVGMLAVLGIVFIVSGVFNLVVGIIGVKNAANLAKAGQLYTLGIVLMAIAAVSPIFSIVTAGDGGFSSSSVTGFILPVLFFIGAKQMKDQTAKQ